MKWTVYLLSLVLVMLAPQAQARMYQWVSAESGSTQLSGKPPSWYRSVHGGPRVIVFEKGKVVDDTAIAVPEAQREFMRAKAFGLLLSSDAKERDEKPEMAAKLKEIADSELFEEMLSEEESVAEAVAPESEEGKTKTIEEQLKAVIAAWEKLKTDQAKSVLSGKAASEGEPNPDSASETAPAPGAVQGEPSAAPGGE